MAQFACVGRITADRLRVLEIEAKTPSDEAETVVRRMIALVVDLAFVLLPSLILAILLTERFTILGAVSNGRPVFDAADQQRINEIDQSFNRAVRLGDTVHTLSGTGLVLTVATLIFLSGAVFFIVPAAFEGLTPGRLLLGFPRRDQEEPGAEVIDVSWSEEAADSSEAHVPGEQTTEETAAVSDAEEEQNRTADSSDERMRESEPSSIQPGTQAPTYLEDQHLEDQHLEDQQLEDQQLHDEHLEDQHLEDQHLGDQQPHDEQREAQPAQLNTASLNDLNELFDYEQNPWKAAPQITLGDDEDYSNWDEAALPSLAKKASDSRDSAGSFERLNLPESSLSESSLTTTTASITFIETDQEPDEEAHTDAGPTETPEWSEAWQAWVYQDKTSDRWFRHDSAEDCWLPIG